MFYLYHTHLKHLNWDKAMERINEGKIKNVNDSKKII
jgi:hypothetical protein